LVAVLSIRIDFGPGQRIGPGKVLLLERIGELGSISAAGRALGMSYRRAWLLVDELNAIFSQQVVTSKAGGKRGGGAELTALGMAIVMHYRSMERAAAEAGRDHLEALNSQVGMNR
jgi:molybdate transport system regulatory protein